MLLKNGFRILITIVVACAASWAPAQAAAPRFTSAPALTPNPNPSVPLAAILRFEASAPVTTTINVSDGTNAWELHYAADRSPKNGLPVIGMRPGKRHQIRVTIRNQAGQNTKSPTPLSFQTPELPAGFPPLKVTRSDKGREPGLTVISLRSESDRFGALVAYDVAGTPVWYYTVPRPPSDFERLPNGNIRVMLVDQRVQEVDMLGNLVHEWYAAKRGDGLPSAGTPVDALALHHEFETLPSGNLVALSTDRREMKDYFTSDTDSKAPRKTQFAMGDRVIEFQPDGKIVWEWNVFDHLATARIGYGSLGQFWSRRGFPNTVDWTHGNSVIYVAKDDSYLVSLRHQSSIYKVSRKTGGIVWILGDPAAYAPEMRSKVLTPLGGMRWPWYGHTLRLTPEGTLLFFDNAVYGAVPFDTAKPPSAIYSRGVEYSIDEAARTVREVWSSGSPGKDVILAMDMGGVSWLPRTRNILVCYGSSLTPKAGVDNWDELQAGRRWTAVREFTHDQPARLVWEATVEDTSPDPASWAAYRAEHWAGIQP